MQNIVASILCHNDIIYLEHMIPKLQGVCDKIIVVDDMSTDGTDEYLKGITNLTHIKNKFEFDFATQRNISLNYVSLGDWVIRIDSDELPTSPLLSGLRDVAEDLDSVNADRAFTKIYNLTSESKVKDEVGVELRLFKYVPGCKWEDKTHERLTGSWPGMCAYLPKEYGLVHFKFWDKNKVNETNRAYVDNGIYDKYHWEFRKNSADINLPSFVDYEISDSLKTYLNNSKEIITNV